MWRDPSGMAPEKEKNGEKLQGWEFSNDIATEMIYKHDNEIKSEIDFSYNIPAYMLADYDGIPGGYTYGNMDLFGSGFIPSGGSGGKGFNGTDLTADNKTHFLPDHIERFMGEPGGSGSKSASGSKTGLDVQSVYNQTQVYRNNLINHDHSKEIGYKYYYNVNDDGIYGEFKDGIDGHNMDCDLSNGPDFPFSAGYRLIAFEHTHNSNQPLEPLDFNCIGYNINLLTTEKSDPINPFRQFIMFCTTITGGASKTSYGFIENASMFQKWYNNTDNYNNTNFRLWEANNWEGKNYFKKGEYNNAYNWFGNILNNPKNRTGVRYGKLP
jgi:hypothetical protein